MDIKIIGAGQAALSVASSLRNQGFEGSIAIYGDEDHIPYQRPPLSKAYLLGDMTLERLYLRPNEWYDEQNIALHTRTKIIKINPEAKFIQTENADHISYDKLILATGSRPRTLPASLTQNLQGLFSVRNIDDVHVMKPYFEAGKNLIVIGGGYIGLEAAAVARKFGVHVTVVEAAPRILARVASEKTAQLIEDLHKSNDVNIITNAKIQSFQGENGKISAIILENGERIPADFIIVGIGIETNSELAEEAGLEVNEGVIVNEFAQTSNPDIYAVGDVARFQFRDQLIRLESVGNAIAQGELVAGHILGDMTAYEPKPWFWSDQYDMTLQIAGLNLGYDSVVHRKNPANHADSVWYYKDDQLIAVATLGDPKTYMIAKRILDNGKSVPKDAAANPEIELKSFMR